MNTLPRRVFICWLPSIRSSFRLLLAFNDQNFSKNILIRQNFFQLKSRAACAVKQTVIKSRQAAPVGQQRVVNQRWNHAAYRFTMRLMTPLMNCKSLAFISPDGRDEMMQRRLLRTPTCLGGHRRDGIGDAGRTPTSASSAFDVSAGVDLMSRLCARPGYLRERRWEKWRINSPVLAGALIELDGNIQIKWNNISWAIRKLVRWNALNVSYKIKKQFFYL